MTRRLKENKFFGDYKYLKAKLNGRLKKIST